MVNDDNQLDRWLNIVAKSGGSTVLGDGGVRRFTDAAGATIVEHDGGRFRFDSFQQKWIPDA